MKKIRFAVTFAIGVILFFAGCSSQMALRNDYVASNSDLFRSDVLKGRRAILVIDSYLKNYRLSRPVYSWAGGNLPSDDISFDVGKALAVEISNMCAQIFLSVDEAGSLKRARERSTESTSAIVIPEILKAEILFPRAQFGNIEAELVLRYSFYDPSGNLNDQETVTGRGEKQLVFTRKNYRLAMEAAVRDLILKSNMVFLQVLK